MAHPKMVQRWLGSYLKIYKTDGRELAHKWANDKLSKGQREAMTALFNQTQKTKKGPKGPNKE
jgi:hypothetical protein